MIKTKSIYDSKEKNDGTRILITRYWPRGIKKDHFDRWIKELSPSTELLKQYKNKKIDVQTFEKLFLREIKTSKSIKVCKEIANECIQGTNFTLLCYEKEESICHRKFVKNICEKELSKLMINHKDKCYKY
ncbi:MAG: DUF488 family protein [Nitrososphaeraceae archaeon]|nr:DUF488 family protein [Nitrososphaeraceae archaeon]